MKRLFKMFFGSKLSPLYLWVHFTLFFMLSGMAFMNDDTELTILFVIGAFIFFLMLLSNLRKITKTKK
ncbi:hypothetical protein C6501_15385 [Candidatus Poribacteria bacterium]|nr:MAG: hypothetical protein C6501_15385 [Candidatus Poribacteria bacterium]